MTTMRHVCVTIVTLGSSKYYIFVYVFVYDLYLHYILTMGFYTIFVHFILDQEIYNFTISYNTRIWMYLLYVCFDMYS
jgi:hypothetical protein